jgi:hypothetical protein
MVSFMSRQLYRLGKTNVADGVGGRVCHRTGQDGVENKKFLPLLGQELRPLTRLARSQSLYRLRRCFLPLSA